MSIHKDQVHILIDILRDQMTEFISLQSLDDYTPISLDYKKLRTVINQTMHNMRDNDPYNHPSYAGQMLKPPHPVAHISYCLSMLLNPNNHALDGGRASSVMEKELIKILGALFIILNCRLFSTGSMLIF